MEDHKMTRFGLTPIEWGLVASGVVMVALTFNHFAGEDKAPTAAPTPMVSEKIMTQRLCEITRRFTQRAQYSFNDVTNALRQPKVKTTMRVTFGDGKPLICPK